MEYSCFTFQCEYTDKILRQVFDNIKMYCDNIGISEDDYLGKLLTAMVIIDDYIEATKLDLYLINARDKEIQKGKMEKALHTKKIANNIETQYTCISINEKGEFIEQDRTMKLDVRFTKDNDMPGSYFNTQVNIAVDKEQDKYKTLPLLHNPETLIAKFWTGDLLIPQDGDKKLKDELPKKYMLDFVEQPANMPSMYKNIAGTYYDMVKKYNSERIYNETIYKKDAEYEKTSKINAEPILKEKEKTNFTDDELNKILDKIDDEGGNMDSLDFIYTREYIYKRVYNHIMGYPETVWDREHGIKGWLQAAKITVSKCSNVGIIDKAELEQICREIQAHDNNEEWAEEHVKNTMLKMIYETDEEVQTQKLKYMRLAQKDGGVSYGNWISACTLAKRYYNNKKEWQECISLPELVVKILEGNELTQCGFDESLLAVYIERELNENVTTKG